MVIEIRRNTVLNRYAVFFLFYISICFLDSLLFLTYLATVATIIRADKIFTEYTSKKSVLILQEFCYW